MKKYGSIYVGTFEIGMKIYEIGRGGSFRNIDTMKKNTSVFHDIYRRHELSPETVEMIIETLADMQETMKLYKAEYKVYGSYSLESAKNILFVLDQIRMRLGIDVKLMSNSEQRFTTYQVFANTRAESFAALTKKSAIMVDVGGYSMQLTLFVDGRIVTTQHILLGAADIREYARRLSGNSDYREQIFEMLQKELEAFSNMYLSGISPENLIILNDNASEAVTKYIGPVANGSYRTTDYVKGLTKLLDENHYATGSNLAPDPGRDQFYLPILFLLNAISRILPSKYVCFPGLDVNDGFVFNMAVRDRLIKPTHDFEEDVISAARFIARRYGSYEPHLNVLDALGTDIIDTMKKSSGLTARDRLIYRVAAILHDCGKYVSLSNSGENSYRIIVSSEILGLTHKEREMAAFVALFNRKDVLPYENLANEFTEEEYVRIVKILAVLRVTNALDRSHKQKFKKVRMSIKDSRLIISISSEDSISLEKSLFENKADFFERTFSIRPVIHEVHTK